MGQIYVTLLNVIYLILMYKNKEQYFFFFVLKKN